MAKQTYNPCDDCKYNFSYNNQECPMCKICEFKHFLAEYHAQKSEVERLERICNSYALQYGTVTDQQKAIDKAKSEVARAFRQRMNEKMGKHTHLLGKEYVQRIMREIEKEFTEVENER